jgi:hypothetical protein
MAQAGKPVPVEALVANAAVEALYEGVLDGPAWLDEMQLDATGPCPLIQRLAGEFRSVVDDDGLGPAVSSGCSV